MHRRLKLLGSCLLACAFLGLPIERAAAVADSGSPTRYIGLVGKSANPRTAATRLAKVTGGRVVHVYEHALRGFAIELPANIAVAGTAAPALGINALYADVDVVVRKSIDPVVGDFTEDHSGPQYVPEGIRRIGGPQSSTIAGDGRGAVDVDVAIMDTGIEADHPDLNVVGGVDCTGTGLPPHEQLLGKPPWSDTNGHGTHVAGTVAAKDNKTGVVGVAPGARLWAVKVITSQQLPGTDEDTWVGTVPGVGGVPEVTPIYAQTPTSSILCGLDWVAAHSGVIEVLNMSLHYFNAQSEGCDGRVVPNRQYLVRNNEFNGDAEVEATCEVVRRGVTVVAASGNDGEARPKVPARLNEVIGVSGLSDHDGKPGGLARAKDTCPDYSILYTTRRRYLPSRVFELGEKLLYGETDADYRARTLTSADDSAVAWANHGTEVDLIAPATCVLSTFYRGTYSRNDGTSMASPHAAGAAALYLSTHPDATPPQVRVALIGAGTYDYSNAKDPDGVKEPLLNVSSF